MSDSNNFVLKRIGTYDLTGTRLGKGNFAFVELATNRVTKTKVAMKVIDTRKIKDDYVKKNILREALLLKRVHHPNIVRLYETLKQNSIYCIVTEFVPGGELLNYLRSQNDSKLSESQARPIMRQLISALYHMHEQGIVHRDLKMENILLDKSKKNIKIVDFGLSNICRGDDLLKTQCGSPEYAAPELFRHGCRYGTEVDLWSLGVIMYGIVIGRLPFRSPHRGTAGRNDLVDQTSRGLSCTHNKYLVHLTPPAGKYQEILKTLSIECRDLLRKLLEPRPELRLPLLEVMVHPWVTVQGTAPLVPCTEQPIDEKLHDKVLEKASQLIKINKSKIALHVHQKRFDAITGVYNLLLDQELKRASKSNTALTQTTKENSVIQVSIKSIVSEGKEASDHNRTPPSESGSASSSVGRDSQPEAEQDWEQDSTRKQKVHKPIEHPVKTPLEGLHIRGLRIGSSEARNPKSHPHSKTRPNTAIPNWTSVEKPSKTNGAVSRAWNRAGRLRCKSCIPRFAPKFDSKLQGMRVVMSPRVTQEPEVLASQWESKLKELISEGGNKGSTQCEEDAKNDASIAGENSSENVAAETQIEKSDVHLEHAKGIADESQENAGSPLERMGPRGRFLRDTPGVKKTTEVNKFKGNKAEQTSQPSPKFLTSQGAVCSHKGLPPSSLAAQTVNRPVSPLKAAQFVDLADYHKYVPQPPKARIAGPLDGAARLAVKEGENEEQIDSFYAAYQSYMKNNKPQHRRLSIMQAHEILQHESKFYTKYGRRLSTENSTGNANSDKQPENETSHSSHTSTVTPAIVSAPKANQQQYSIPKPGYLKGVSVHEDQREKILSGLKREEITEKQSAPSNDHLVSPHSSTARSSHDNNPIKGNLPKPNESRIPSIASDSTRPTQPTRLASRLNPRQEESLKRQKEKEQAEDHEREKVKFRKELEDQERLKMITEYLQNVYSQYGQQPSPHATNKKTELNPCTYKVSKPGRVYSVVTRPADKPGSDAPQVITKPMPILRQAARGTQGDKKITFMHQTGVKGANGVRFFNDWNNRMFLEYINSTDGNTAEEKEKDKLQMKDARFWLEQHLNGVLDETTVTRRDLHNYQQVIPRET